MKISLSWLKDFLPLSMPVEDIADTLTLAGLEVDKIEKISPPFSGVVVAKIISVAPHPNADKLRIATVFDGKEELQIVCGAPNCREGLKTALATIGASLTDESGKILKIKKGKLRDVESFGMLCSEIELGFSSSSDGIMEFSDDMKEGTDVASLYDDTILEISLTPNLGRCLSVLGVARELSMFLNLPLTKPKMKLHEETGPQTKELITVSVEDPIACPRYSCRILQEITVGPSPEWMKKRLELSGVRSINNVVDVSNYVMLEYGQPLHMFDYDEISGKKIIVSSSSPYSSIQTLDDIVREIPHGALLICDDSKALAIAGIMGGSSSAVSEKTKTVLIESAYFIASSVRKTSKEMRLRTEGSQRWEREVDPDLYAEALDRAATLLQSCAGGKILPNPVTLREPIPQRQIKCRPNRVNQLLGTHLSFSEIETLFQRLNLKVKESYPESMTLVIPSYRTDLKEEIDLVEEIARLHGFNNLSKESPVHITSPLEHHPVYLFEKEMRGHLIASGLQEWLTCDLISPQLAALTMENGLKSTALISVLHPTSIDQSILRASLLPGFLQAVKYNQDHLNDDIKAFEVGRIHFKEKDQFFELSSAGILLTGKDRPHFWGTKPQEVDFYELKGIAQNVLELIGIKATFETSHFHNFHPYRQARIKVDGIEVGALGEVHPSHLRELGITKKVYYAELNLHDMAPFKRKELRFSEIPSFPGSQRDWTLSIKKEAPIQLVFDAVGSARTGLLEKFQLLDLYESEQIGKDRKNVTFRFFYRDPQKNITTEAIEHEHTKMIQAVAEKLTDHLVS